ncbi:hypothetical protein K9L27_03100 [Candidatus Gracilibacteria bacterium]|nr:hypothetical protein [Candidatus Gracilibacteria bacterium]
MEKEKIPFPKPGCDLSEGILALKNGNICPNLHACTQGVRFSVNNNLAMDPHKKNCVIVQQQILGNTKTIEDLTKPVEICCDL